MTIAECVLSSNLKPCDFGRVAEGGKKSEQLELPLPHRSRLDNGTAGNCGTGWDDDYLISFITTITCLFMLSTLLICGCAIIKLPSTFQETFYYYCSSFFYYNVGYLLPGTVYSY